MKKSFQRFFEILNKTAFNDINRPNTHQCCSMIEQPLQGQLKYEIAVH